MKQNIDNDWDSTIKLLSIIGIVIGLATYRYISKINYYLSLFLFWMIIVFLVIFVYLILFGFTHISIKSGTFIFNSATYKIKKRKEEERFIQNEAIEIENLLETNLPTDEPGLTNETEKIKKMIGNSRYYDLLKHFLPELKKRLAKATELLEEIRKKHIAEYWDREIRQKQEKIGELDKEINAKQAADKEIKNYILWKLDAERNPVFFKDKLTKKQKNALLEDDFKSVSEYSITENKLINILIKPKLNHSATHTFLVWNMIRLLKTIKGVEEIKEHLSVNADITFNFNGKTYALEIETGTLLGKTKQTQEKINYLNKRYPNRWMFIVSNRDLLKKYNKLGFATQRKEVAKNLAKMLKIAHPF